MKRLSAPSFVSGALAATVLCAVPLAAAMHTTGADSNLLGFDATTPSLTAHPTKFVLGASIDAAPATPDACGWTNRQIPLRMTWSGSDASGVMGYDVWVEHYPSPPSQEYSGSHLAYDFIGGDDFSGCRGAPQNGAYWVAALDRTTNRATTAPSNGQVVDVWQETGQSNPSSPSTLSVVKSGVWSAATCSCSNAGATWFSTTAGSSLTYTLRTYGAAQTVGVVAPLRTGGGGMNISVDGAAPTLVDTYTSTPRNRVIVWQLTIAAAGIHQVKITNAGTAGRSRVDVDSILLTEGKPGRFHGARIGVHREE